MIKEKEEKFHCYGDDSIYNQVQCGIVDHCRYLQACSIMCGFVYECKQWELINLIHELHTSGEVMELLQINFQISYNAAKMSLKRWRARQNENNN